MKAILVLSIMLFAFCATISAQPSGRFLSNSHGEFDQAGDDDQGGSGRMKGHRARLEKFRMAKMLELLELEEATEKEFVGLAKNFRQNWKQFMQDRGELIHEMSTALHEGEIDNKTSQSFIEKLQDLEGKQHLLRSEFMTESAKILTADQMVRLVVFQERFEHRLMERLRGMRGPGGMGRRGEGRWQKKDSLDGRHGKKKFDDES